ncbi:hypothetical protein E4U35_000133 [Claviceps purpurea]|nr:hypothetical protein E4U35_000133 [Claviceps purpurea]
MREHAVGKEDVQQTALMKLSLMKIFPTRISLPKEPSYFIGKDPADLPAEGFDSGNLPEESASYCVLYFEKEDFDTEQNQPEGSISERMLAFEENQTFNDAEDSSDVDLIVTEDPTASVNARASDADKNA